MSEWWREAWIVVQHEFSDLPAVGDFTRVCVRLLMATVLGGIIGYERESSGSAAGFRTHMLVALGAALFVLVPLQAGMESDDISRVVQGVVSGIGFLGAGAIIKHGQGLEVHGLTTAASVWLTCAIGLAAGMGHEATAIVSTFFALLILLLVRVIKTPDQGQAGKLPKT
ncbi:putative Mg2+ transporter-C (MgtC) family protein [Paucimonas lemoignei]|uniref:Protein MgtC n=1 Tax=Paucimonas lemoignei TaxID=29443 RepID=A0A4R3I0C9_PAULE|nr:MgtC/SapB family protein [Paucimonas lemoignei]TCS38423.1 putative Mg2+ transporter-C (MgtC) family protein [Paucimonas lemoignei]